jgi:hypothetical protein
MKATRIISLGMVLGIVLLVNPEAKGEKGTETANAQAIEPKLIMEYKFDEPVVDVIFSEATMTVKEARALGMKGLEKKKATERVKVQYPKVIFANNTEYRKDIGLMTSIKFLDKKGKIKKEITPLQYFPDKPEWVYPYGKPKGLYFNLSKNRKYICINIPSPIKKEDWDKYGDDCYKFAPEGETIVLNTEGDILQRIKTSGDCDFVSPNGNYVIDTDVSGESAGPLVIYDENGTVKEIPVTHIGDGELDFSKDGTWFAMVIETVDTKQLREAQKYDKAQNYEVARKLRKEARRTHLVVFDEKGNELWRKEVARDPWIIDTVSISEDDIITVTMWHFYGSEKGRVYHFDKKGNLIEPKSKEEE